MWSYHRYFGSVGCSDVMLQGRDSPEETKEPSEPDTCYDGFKDSLLCAEDKYWSNYIYLFTLYDIKAVWVKHVLRVGDLD